MPRDAELAVRARQPELAEEGSREGVLVVLAGMDKQLLGPLPQGARDGGCLDELGAVADDGEDAHRGGYARPAGIAPAGFDQAAAATTAADQSITELGRTT